MAKREGELKQKFAKELKLQLPLFRMYLLATSGAADRVIIGNKFTSFWEFKHADPFFSSNGLQELECMRADVQGFCRYVIFYERIHIQRTLIVKPENVYDGSWLTNNEACDNFDHEWLVRYVKGIHGL